MNNRAVLLLSGGLDSTTLLAIAKQQGYDCYTLSFDYGQRHSSELTASLRIANAANVVEHKTVKIDLGAIGGSALTDHNIEVPHQHLDIAQQDMLVQDIPITYVPARNMLFLSYALGWAEVLEARNIFIGVNAVDYSGYPDCRPEFIESFEVTANLATKAGVEGYPFRVHTPLIELSKGEIIGRGVELGVDYAETVSCYQADEQGRACGKCDSCQLRRTGFIAAGVDDPTLYL
ncbi:MAG: 7-cyano-7-deazaguanine synthase QueC [Thiotrichales bacterium]|jgi:7-cyano-7-deazaguanine synthase|nr:7-cyano-7-deazaguanine synthase QueC [Thiotrichales bacterium]MBT3612866.1 7-cyano-7-deazaguanine synthase QueC [Thiotrichales bacterium]MBT3752750.1 7-cyano-7-deazaguanine synthase QueC [Thiotrichales bacterium]MBT3836767.1 7-cyano-7-deazaguanine synthase QueC [Thiotrichales bacterium]MBT4152403.1 7-cyano-7-deazaguanine synthase QueC [Thiotrichales bacterium]